MNADFWGGKKESPVGGGAALVVSKECVSMPLPKRPPLARSIYSLYGVVDL